MKSKIKCLPLLIFAICISGCHPENPDQGDPYLIAYFPFDSSFDDKSGNDNILQVFGNPQFTEGYIEDSSIAIYLDGENDYLVSHIGIADTFSISMWVQSYTYFVGEWPPRRSTVFDYSEKQVYGYIDGASGATMLNGGIESEPLAGAMIDNCNNWFHIYLAVNNDMKIYLDGICKDTVPLEESMTYLNDIIYFGRSSSDDEIALTYFYGNLDEIRVYNRILEPSEIEQLALKK